MPKRPVRSGDDAASVEDELVLSSHGVHVDDPRVRLEGAVAADLDTLARLAAVVRRAVDVQDHRSLPPRVRVERRPGCPRVLAHGQAELGAREPDGALRLAGNERALLVEHAVVRQLHLVVPGHDLTVREEPGGVVDAGVGPVDEPGDDGASSRGLLGEPFEGGEVVLDERGSQHEVLGRVAGERQFREHDHVGTGFGGSGRPSRHEVHVAVEVSDGRVDLAERDAHHRRQSIGAFGAVIPTRCRRCPGCTPPRRGRRRAGDVGTAVRGGAGGRSAPPPRATSRRSWFPRDG